MNLIISPDSFNVHNLTPDHVTHFGIESSLKQTFRAYLKSSLITQIGIKISGNSFQYSID